MQRGDHRSRVTRARQLVATGTAIQIGDALYISWKLWSRSGADVAVAVIIVSTPLLLGLLAVRKPWGVSVVLLVAWCLWPPGMAIANVGVGGLNYSVAGTYVLSGGLLLVGFVIALRAHLARPALWRTTAQWDDWLPP